jgi:predicted HTH transcriptional regulator
LEIKSPGELLGSVSVTNLINCVPAYRNFLLAEGSRLSALSDKIGNGIDLVYEGVLHQGLDFPQFESAHGQFIARISLAGNAHFRAFMRKFAQALGELEEVIALRLLWSREFASVEELAAAMQRPVTRARHTLGELLRKGMATEGPNSTTFQLAQVVRKDIENIFGEQLSFEQRTLWGE